MEKTRTPGRCWPRRPLRRARRIQAAMPREPEVPDFRASARSRRCLPRRFNPLSGGKVQRVDARVCLSPSLRYMGESGPFCPICLGLTCWHRPHSASAVFLIPALHAIRRVPDAEFWRAYYSLECQKRTAEHLVRARVSRRKGAMANHDSRGPIPDSRITSLCSIASSRSTI